RPRPGGIPAIGSFAPTAAPNSTQKRPSLASPARTWGRSAPDVMPPAGNSTNCSTEPADPPWIGISEGVGPCQPARPGKSAPEGPRGVRALDRGRALPGRRGQGGAPGAERGGTTLTLALGDAG